MKKKDFRKLTGLSYATIAKLGNGDNVMSSILENICLKLDCSIGDIMEIVQDVKKITEEDK